MYIFRLAPISNDKSKWSDSSAITYTSIQDPDDVLSGEWMSSQAYMTGEYATRNQYVMVSLKNDNLDDPIYNYIGRTPDPWKDALLGYGQNSWLKLRTVSKFLCFNREQPGYTWSISGNIAFSIKPSLAMNAEESWFFGDGVVSTPLHLILTDVIGDSVIITYKTVGGTVISTETVALTHKSSFINDWGFNLELPGTPENTIIRKYDVLDGVHSIDITITPPTTGGDIQRAGLGGFYIGRATKIGTTQQDKLSFGFLDYSKVTEDSWGHISVSKSKVSKTIDAEVFIPTAKSDQMFKLMQHVRATPTFFLFSNRLEEACVIGTVISGLTGIMGLVKSSNSDKKNARESNLSVNIEALPVTFNDNMIKESDYICGSPYLPVVPVTPITPVAPPTPPPSTVVPTGVVLNRATISLGVNKTSLLIATVLPTNAGNKTVTWSTSDAAVATVSSSGLVTGKGLGTCTITVTTTVGSFTDTCSVNVVEIVP